MPVWQRMGLGVLGDYIPAGLVDEVLADTGRVQQRVRRLPARVVVWFILALTLFGGQGYRGVWRELAHSDADGAPTPSASGLSQARRRLGVAPLAALFVRLRGPQAVAGAPGAFLCGLRLVSWDATMLDVPDSPANAEAFIGSVNARGRAAYERVVVDQPDHATGSTYRVRLGREVRIDAPRVERVTAEQDRGCHAGQGRRPPAVDRGHFLRSAPGRDERERVRMSHPVQDFLLEHGRGAACRTRPLRSRAMSRWSIDQVLALAPDASSQKAARSLATPRRWPETGHDAARESLWGRCQGSGKEAYQVCVDLTEPAYRCSCPSRKFPCKHALALLMLWANGAVMAGQPPDWLCEWRSSRAARQAKAAARPVGGPASEKTVQRRSGRVEAGMGELDRWLGDQVRQGLAGAARLGYGHWAAMAARLVDAQAPGVAAAVGRLSEVAGDPESLLAELALLRLLVTGYRRLGELPADLAATVRSRIGFPVTTEEVLAGPALSDEWQVLGVRDEAEGQLTVRRIWLRGVRTGRSALVLSFAAPGQALAVDLVLGTAADMELCFYPGAQPLRAVAAGRHGTARTSRPSGGVCAADALDGYATALAADPWLEQWPVLLGGVRPVWSGRWYLVDAKGDGLPLRSDIPEPWPLVAVAGAEPVTVAAEWSAAGLRPLTVWTEDRMVRL
jgi:hypothetical protein